jgi:hypothetical protein
MIGSELREEALRREWKGKERTGEREAKLSAACGTMLAEFVSAEPIQERMPRGWIEEFHW